MPTIPNQKRETVYQPVSATADFSVGFLVYDPSDLLVYLNGVLKTKDTDYIVVGDFTLGYSESVIVRAIGSGWTGYVEIVGARSPRRSDQFEDGRGVPALDQNMALNRLSVETRENHDKLSRVMARKRGAAATDWDAGGQKIVNVSDGSAGDDVATVGQVESVAAAKAAEVAAEGAAEAGATAGADAATALINAAAATSLSGGKPDTAYPPAALFETLGAKVFYATASQWTTANPVLAQGEWGKESDTGKFKNGDGVTAWNALSYQPSGAALVALAALTPAADKLPYFSGASAAALASLTAFARTLLAAGDAAAARAVLGTISGTDYINLYNLFTAVNDGLTALDAVALKDSDVGTTANKLVQLDGSARLPAVDGSQLTGLPSSGGVLRAASPISYFSTQSAAWTHTAGATGNKIRARGAVSVTTSNNGGSGPTPPRLQVQLRRGATVLATVTFNMKAATSTETYDYALPFVIEAAAGSAASANYDVVLTALNGSTSNIAITASTAHVEMMEFTA